MQDWLTQLGSITVERREIPRGGGKPYYPQAQTGIGVLHTVEGKDSPAGLESAVRTLSGANSHGQPDPPHFLIGSGRILQLRPLSKQASSLVSPQNAYAQVQIEMMGFTAKTPAGVPLDWIPDAPVLGPLLELMRFFKATIPLQVPVEAWRDDGSDMQTIWATNNTRRRDAVKYGWWPVRKGWWMHAEVPFQAKQWHWDCGRLQRRQIFKMV